MPHQILFKEENEELFWKQWENYVYQQNVGPLYLKTSWECFTLTSKERGFLLKDKSFVYLVNNVAAGCVFLPIEKHGTDFFMSIVGYIPAPLIHDKKVEKKIFNLIDEIAKENNVSKIMFSIDPLENNKDPYNFLQKYHYLDTSILSYIIKTGVKEEILEGCRKGHKYDIKRILKDKNFETFIIDKNNASYESHEEYRKLHHKCAGKVTRSKESFDLQFKMLKEGHAILTGIKYKRKNVGYSYFTYNTNGVLYFSGADNPQYNHFPLYHAMLFSAMEYFHNKGLSFIDPDKPSSPSVQLDYYPDEKQLNIALFKRGFPGNFRQNFRGIKYFSKNVFKKDMDIFANSYPIETKHV